MERKLGINLEFQRGIERLDAIEMLKNAGFTTFFTGPAKTPVRSRTAP